MKERSFEKEVQINKFKLDDECEIHSSFYLYWNEELADAKAAKDCAEDALSLTLAEAEMHIRKTPPEGIKITESVIKALVMENESVKKHKEELRQIKESIYHLEAAVKAFEHRKSQLNNLVSLYATGYFSAPSTQKRNTINDDAGKSIRKNLNRRKKGE